MTVTTEPSTTASRHLKLVLALAACLVTALVAASPGEAGVYSVRQCDYAAGIGHHEGHWQWAGTVAGGHPSVVQHSGTGCSEFGLALRNNLGGNFVTHANGAYGGYFFYAPNGTSFTHFSGAFGTTGSCCVSGMAAYGEASQNHVGSAGISYLFQGDLGNHTFGAPSGVGGPVGRAWNSSQSGWTAARVGFHLRCGPGFNCNQGVHGDTRVRGRSFEFHLNDHSAPGINGTGGSLVSGVWVRGTQSLDFSAGDAGGGIAGVTARFDSGQALQSPSSCSIAAGRYISLQPCPLGRSGTWSVDTTSIPDGPHHLTVYATDVGGATGQQVRAVYIDNHAPAVPSGLSVAGGEGWRSSNAFALSWSNPGGQVAPVTKVYYELCPVAPAGACTVGSRSAHGIENMDLSVPAGGAYSLRTWLEDWAGNVNASSKSEPVMLRFDDQVPGRAQPAVTAGWLNGADAEGFQQAFGLAAGEVRPLGGIGGYSVTTNGDDPDGTVDVAGDPATLTIAVLPEGQTTIKARAVAVSGVASPSVGSTVVRVDKSAPSASISGAPDSAVWSRSSVPLRLSGSDQAGLSGMPAAPVGAPVEQGGYLAYRLNGGLAQKIRGAQGGVTVAGDGRHTLTYQAVDAAGNPSVEKTAQFKVDRTAPAGSFDYQDPGDPRRLSVAVFDATSGVAGGQLEYRREGAGEFRSIPTSFGQGKLVAQLDDVALPNGRYEFRARTRDVAGNQSSIDRRADGRAMVLSLPIRITTKTTVVTGGGVKLSACAVKASKKKSRKKRRKAMRKCKKRKVVVSPGRASVKLRYGKRARTVGQVATTAGIPVPHAYVAVEGQLRSGGPFARIGAARADGQGVFRFMVPPGPSRTIRFRYEGASTIRPSIGQLATKVQGALTLKVSRRRARNGQRVVFRGRLRGKPFPSGGKLIVLKAKVPGFARWRTFGTTRTNAKGRYRYPRKFTSTRGLVRYVFRAEAPREVIYSYEKGLSKTKQVIVKGPGG